MQLLIEGGSYSRAAFWSDTCWWHWHNRLDFQDWFLNVWDRWLIKFNKEQESSQGHFLPSFLPWTIICNRGHAHLIVFAHACSYWWLPFLSQSSMCGYYSITATLILSLEHARRVKIMYSLLTARYCTCIIISVNRTVILLTMAMSNKLILCVINFYIIQVCICSSQSWDHVTEHYAIVTIECRLVQHACTDEDYTPHCRPRVAAQTHRVMVTFSLSLNVESTTRPWQRANITSRFARGLVAWAGLSKRAALAPLTRARETHLYGP